MDGPTNAAAIPETTDEHRELVTQRIRFTSDVIPGIRDDAAHQRSLLEIEAKRNSTLVTGFGSVRPNTMALNYAPCLPRDGQDHSKYGRFGAKELTGFGRTPSIRAKR